MDIQQLTKDFQNHIITQSRYYNDDTVITIKFGSKKATGLDNCPNVMDSRQYFRQIKIHKLMCKKIKRKIVSKNVANETVKYHQEIESRERYKEMMARIEQEKLEQKRLAIARDNKLTELKDMIEELSCLSPVIKQIKNSITTIEEEMSEDPTMKNILTLVNEINYHCKSYMFFIKDGQLRLTYKEKLLNTVSAEDMIAIEKIIKQLEDLSKIPFLQHLDTWDVEYLTGIKKTAQSSRYKTILKNPSDLTMYQTIDESYLRRNQRLRATFIDKLDDFFDDEDEDDDEDDYSD